MAQVVLLLWLKIRLTYRRFQRSPAQLIGLIIMVVFFGSLSLVGFFGLLVLFLTLPSELNRELLHGLFAALYFIWLLSPLFGVNLNESYDLSKLLLYPIPYRTMFFASILGNFLDPPVLLLSPPLLAVLLGFSPSVLSVLMSAAAIVVFFFHTISLSQTLMLLLWGFLRSRRTRDLAIVFAPVLGLTFFAFHQMAVHGMLRGGWAFFLNVHPSRYLQWLPCGATANAIWLTASGQPLKGLASLLLLVALCALTVQAAGYLIKLLYIGKLDVSVKLATRPRAAKPERRKGFHILRQKLPPEIEAVALKEFKYLFRDPQLKALLLRTLSWPVVYVLLFAVRPYSGFSSEIGIGQPRLDLLWFIIPTLVILFSALTLSSNAFAHDREGLNLLFLFPCKRQRLLMGKNFSVLLLLTAFSVVVLTVMTLVTHRVDLLLICLPGVISLLLIFIGGGNLLSVYFPYRLPSKTENPMTVQQGRGCLWSLLYLVSWWALFMAAAPAAAAVWLPVLLDAEWLYILGMPFALLYSACLFYASLRVAGEVLLRREADIIKAVTGEG